MVIRCSFVVEWLQKMIEVLIDSQGLVGKSILAAADSDIMLLAMVKNRMFKPQYLTLMMA